MEFHGKRLFPSAFFFYPSNPSRHIRKGKGCVRKTVPERIYDPFRRARYGLKIAVAHIDIIGVIHVSIRRMESLCGRIILQRSGKSICQLPRRAAVTHQQLRRRVAALHAALPGKQSRGNGVIVPDPARICHAAHIQENNDLRKMRGHILKHPVLRLRQVKVRVLKNRVRQMNMGKSVLRLILRTAEIRFAVPPFSGIAAEGDNRRVRPRCRPLQQVSGNFRFRNQPRNSSLAVCLLHIMPVKFRAVRKYRHLSA